VVAVHVQTASPHRPLRAPTLQVATPAPLSSTGTLLYNYNTTSSCGSASGSLALTASVFGSTSTGTGALLYTSCTNNATSTNITDASPAFTITGSVVTASRSLGSLTLTSSNIGVIATLGGQADDAWNVTYTATGSLGGLGVTTTVAATSSGYSTTLALITFSSPAGETLALSASSLLYTYANSCSTAYGPATASLSFAVGGLVTVGTASGSLTGSACGIATPTWSTRLNVGNFSVGSSVAITALTAIATRATGDTRWSVALNGSAVLSQTVPVSLSAVSSSTASTPTFIATVVIASDPTTFSPFGVAATGTLTSSSGCVQLSTTGQLTTVLGGVSVSGTGTVTYDACISPCWTASFPATGVNVGPATMSATFSATRSAVAPAGYAVPPWIVSFGGTGTVGASLALSAMTGTITSAQNFTASATLTSAVSASGISLSGTGRFSYDSFTACAAATVSATAAATLGGATPTASGTLTYSCASGWSLAATAAPVTFGALVLSSPSLTVSTAVPAPQNSDWTALVSGTGTLGGATDVSLSAAATLCAGSSSIVVSLALVSSTSPISFSGDVVVYVSGGVTTASGTLSLTLSIGGTAYTMPAGLTYNSGASPLWSFAPATADIAAALASAGAKGLGADASLSISALAITRATGAASFTTTCSGAVSLGPLATLPATLTISSPTSFTVAGSGTLNGVSMGGLTAAGTLAFSYDGTCATASVSSLTLSVNLAGGYSGTGSGSLAYSSCDSAAWRLTASMANAGLGDDLTLSSVVITATRTSDVASQWAIIGSASAALGLATAIVSFSSAAGIFSGSASVVLSTSNFIGTVTLAIPQVYSNECLGLIATGSATLKLLSATSPPIASMTGTYSPCNNALTLSGSVSGGFFTLGSDSMTVSTVSLAYTTAAGLSGSLAAVATAGPFTGDLTVSFTGAEYSTAAQLSVAFPYGKATANVSSSSSCNNAMVQGSIAIELSNLPSGLPPFDSVTGDIWRACNGSGLWTASVSLPDFSFNLGAGPATLTSVTVFVVTNVDRKVSLTFSAKVGALKVSVFVATDGSVSVSGQSEGALTLSAVASALTGSSTLFSRGPGDLSSEMSSYSLTGVAFSGSVASRCLSFSATAIISLSTADLTGQVCLPIVSDTATLHVVFGVALSLPTLPLVFSSLGSSMTLPLLTYSNYESSSPVVLTGPTGALVSLLPGGSIALQASSLGSFQGLSLTDASLVFPVATTASGSVSLACSATATVSGLSVSVAFTRTAAGEFTSFVLTLQSSSSGSWPLSFSGVMSYTNTGTAVASGTLSALSFAFGGRTLSLASGSATIALSGSTLTLSAPLPSLKIASVAVSAVVMTAVRVSGDWTVSIAGSATMPGFQSKVKIVFSSPSVYSVSAEVALSTSAVEAAGSFALVDSGSCSTLSGTFSTLGLTLNGDSISLSGLAASYNTCSGAVSLATTQALSASLLGMEISVTQVSLSRASSSAAWVGVLSATSTEGVSMTGVSFTGTQSLSVAFASTGLSSASLAIAVASGTQFSVVGSMTLAAPRSTACTAAGGWNTAYLSASVAVPMPTSSSLSLSGSAKLRRSCTGDKKWELTIESPSVYPVDLGTARISISGLTVSYASATKQLSLSGVFSNSLLVTIAGSPSSSSYLMTVATLSPMTLGAAIAACTGINMEGAGIGELSKPLMHAVLESFALSLSVDGSTKKTACAAMAGSVSNVFGGGSVGIAAQACNVVGTTQVSWVVGASIDLSTMALPSALKMLKPLVSGMTLSLGGGTPLSTQVAGTKISLPSAVTSALAMRLPSLYSGASGVSLGGTLSVIGNSLATFISKIPGGDSGPIGSAIKALGDSITVSTTLGSASAFSLSIGFLGSLAVGPMTLQTLALYMGVSPLAVTYGISVVVSGQVMGGTTLVGAGLMSLTTGASGVISLVVALGFDLITPAGDHTWRPFGSSSPVGIIMPLSLQLGIGIVGIIPFITELGLAGGATIGAVSSYLALQLNLADFSKTAFMFSMSLADPTSLLASITGCSSCFKSAGPILANLLTGTFTISMNPSPFAVTVGPPGAAVSIPGGNTIGVYKATILNFIYVDALSLTLSSAGVVATAVLGRMNFFGYVTIDCGLCSAYATTGPSFTLSMATSGQYLSIAGGGSIIGDRFGVSLLIKGDTSFAFTASAIVGTASFGSVTVAASGTLIKPSSIVLSLDAFLNLAFLNSAGAAALADTKALAQRVVNAAAKANAGLVSANAGLSKASDALSSSRVATSAISNAQNTVNSLYGQLANYNSNADSNLYQCNRCCSSWCCKGCGRWCVRCGNYCSNCACNWQNCIEYGYDMARVRSCEGAISVASAGLTAASRSYVAAVTAAQGALSVASSSVSAAQTTVNSATKLVQAFSGLASDAASYATNSGFKLVSIVASTTLALRGTPSMNVVLYCVINGNSVSFSLGSLLPIKWSLISDAIKSYVSSYFSKYVLAPAGGLSVFSSLGVRRLQSSETWYGDDAVALSFDPATDTVSSFSVDAATAAASSAAAVWYSNVTGLWQVGETIFALADSPVYTSWYPCALCDANSTTFSGSIAPENITNANASVADTSSSRRLSSRMLIASARDAVNDAVTAFDATELAASHRRLVALENAAPYVVDPTRVLAVVWSGSANVSALCDYLAHNSTTTVSPSCRRPQTSPPLTPPRPFLLDS